MSVDERIPQYRRRSIRLRHHDYRREGAYLVTICAYEHTSIFGSIANGQVRLSNAGQIVRECWCEIPLHFRHVTLDRFVVMADHMHGIVVIRSASANTCVERGDAIPRRFGGALRDSLGAIVGVFKSYATKRIIEREGNRHVWQRNYYETIIRDDRHLNAARRYIIGNPKRWHDHVRRNPLGQRNTSGQGNTSGHRNT